MNTKELQDSWISLDKILLCLDRPMRNGIGSEGRDGREERRLAVSSDLAADILSFQVSATVEMLDSHMGARNGRQDSSCYSYRATKDAIPTISSNFSDEVQQEALGIDGIDANPFGPSATCFKHPAFPEAFLFVFQSFCRPTRKEPRFSARTISVVSEGQLRAT